jgi:DNA-binding NarL/FixJ family response regulator
MRAGEKKRVLIVESREAFRKGLRAIFAGEPVRAEVVVAVTCKDSTYLNESGSFDLIVIQQSLLTDITAISPEKVVILAAELNLELYFLARLYGARAYFYENVPGSLLRQSLYAPPGTFLSDPVASSWLSDYLGHHILVAIDNEVFTPREREVFHLLRRGFSNHDIAQQLNLSEYTIKSHVKSIYGELQLNRRQIRLFSRLEQEEEPQTT